MIRSKLTDFAPLVSDRVTPYEGEREYLATGSVNDNEEIFGEKFTFEDRPSRADLTVKVGDICFARMQNTKKVLLIDEKSVNHIYSTGFAVVRPNLTKIHPRFLYHLIASGNFQNKKNSLCSGATQKAITNEKINSISCIFPPISEQKRIATILGKAAEIKAKREQAIAKLDELVGSIFEEMFSNCNEKASIKDIILKNKITENSDGNSVWSLSLEQIESQSGNLIKKIMVDRKELGTSTFYFQPPVVLYSKLRPYLNKVIIPKENGYATTELVPLYVNDRVLPIFLATVLRSKKFVEFANVNSAGAKMPRVIMDKFWDYQIPVPSITKQKIFSDICNSIESQKIKHFNSYSKAQLLIESLQDQAFSSGIIA